jgi:hypothetical protein
MNIKDIDGVIPNPGFIMYRSKHKDIQLDIRDIDQESKTAKLKKLVKFPRNPLDPQYARLTESKRHVHEYGSIDGGKPKQWIAPRTRRQTNKNDDILGAQPKVRFGLTDRNESPSEPYPRTDSRRMNPITGEEYTARNELPKPISLMKENNSNKSRRLARILENFNRASDYNQRSKSDLKPHYYNNGNNSPGIQQQKSVDRIVSHRQMHNVSVNERNNNSFLSSRDLEPSVLPAFSKRMQGHKNVDFKAYEDNSKLVNNRSIRNGYEDPNRQISKSFIVPDLRKDMREKASKR